MRTSSYDIERAIQTLSSLQCNSLQGLREFQREALAIEQWLYAEGCHKRYIQSWLDAEQRHNYQQWLLENLQVYQCAKSGWLKMRENSPRLDGADSFENLGTGLQMRYARFAAGVLEEVGIFDEAAWTYLDEGD